MEVKSLRIARALLDHTGCTPKGDTTLQWATGCVWDEG